MTSLENSKNDEYSDKRPATKSSPFEFGTLVEPQLFVNTIHRSFQFELPAAENGGQPSIININ